MRDRARGLAARRLAIVAVAGVSMLAGSTLPTATAMVFADDASSTSVGLDQAWPMHPIDGRWRGANALGPGDVNDDGLTDYAVNYEFDQRYVVYLHPPEGTDPRRPWESVDLVPTTLEPGRGVASESAALVDLDGDGNTDVVGAQSGDQFPQIVGYEPGIRVFWGPPADRALDATAWTDAGRMTETIDAGHYHWVKPHDMDRDGDDDLLVGGRVLIGTGDPTGVIWIEAPDSKKARRDLSKWRVHEIDGDQWSGHEALPTDVDDDGDDDVVVANADFDTPEDAEEVVWYENPGDGTERQKGPWRKRQIYASSDFTTKPQLGIGDLDGDGLTDLVTQTPDDLLVFRKTGVSPVRFETIVVPKDERARWIPRTVRVADVDGDGRLDVIGMLSHDDTDVPIDKASVFWMEFDGRRPTAGNWTTHVVNWGPGRTMAIPTLGSKWDQADIVDVDGDRDLDIVANNEEWWVEDDGELLTFDNPARDPESVSVVWFENRLGERQWRCRERGGRCVVEAERPTTIGDGTWPERGQIPDSVGNAMQVFNGVAVERECGAETTRQEPETCPDGDSLRFDATLGLTYGLTLDGGDYVTWLRVRTPVTFGNDLGGTRSDSAWVSLGGTQSVVGEGIAPGAWTWVRAPGAVALEAGRHELELRARERGFAVDRIIVTSDSSFTPSGRGPRATTLAARPTP